MKKSVLIILVVLLFCRCATTNITVVNSLIETDMFEPVLDKKSEKIDLDFFKKQEVSYDAGYDAIIDHIWYHKTLPSGLNIQANGNNEEGYVIILTPRDSYFATEKRYHSNGVIQYKMYRFRNGGFIYGTSYYYDDTGILTEEVNDEKKFIFTFEDILEFCRKEGIEVQKGYIHPRSNDAFKCTYINNSVFGKEKLQSIWSIEYFNKQNNMRELIDLDGMTGNIISKKAIEPLPI